jgi:hypothetical protein
MNGLEMKFEIGMCMSGVQVKSVASQFTDKIDREQNAPTLSLKGTVAVTCHVTEKKQEKKNLR